MAAAAEASRPRTPSRYRTARRTSVAPPSLSLAACRLTVLLAALTVACADESARSGRSRAAAATAESAGASSSAVAPTDSPQGATPAGQGRAPLPLDPAASLDSLAPLAPPGEPASRFPQPDRPVASITSDHWSNEDDRDEAGEARTVIRLLEIGEGERVADIGAGSGYYTVRLSPVVGPGGRVLATDVMPRYLEGLRDRVRKEDLSNVVLGLGDPHDPRLPAGSVDVVLMVHMYHEIEQPYAFLYNLAPAVRSGGRVAVVDLDRETSRHGTPLALLRCEMEAVGYRRVAVHDLGKARGYLAVFAPPGLGGRTVPSAMTACEAA